MDWESHQQQRHGIMTLNSCASYNSWYLELKHFARRALLSKRCKAIVLDAIENHQRLYDQRTTEERYAGWRDQVSKVKYCRLH